MGDKIKSNNILEDLDFKNKTFEEALTSWKIEDTDEYKSGEKDLIEVLKENMTWSE